MGLTKTEQVQAALDLLMSQGHVDAARAVHAALTTKEGRRAAGLPARKRGKEYDPRDATLDTPMAAAALLFAMGEITEREAIDRLAKCLGWYADQRVLKQYLRDILPRVQGIASLVKASK